MTRPPANPALAPEILVLDESLLVVNKRAGVVVEPGLGHARDTLINGLMATHRAELERLGPARDWGLLHRLDRETTGCVVVALGADAYDDLRAQFEERRVEKQYLAVVEGRPGVDSGTIDTPLAEVRRGDMKVSVPGRRGAGRPAVTHYRVLASSRSRSLLLVTIETGRLHQVRAHLASIGTPVTGDRVYRADLPPNTSRPPPGREDAALLLHAWRIGFRHPRRERRMEVEAPIPQAMREAVQAMTGRPIDRLIPPSSGTGGTAAAQ